MRLIDHLERELARIPLAKTDGTPASEAYRAGCESAVRDVIDALGMNDDPIAAIAAVGRRPRAVPPTILATPWRGGRTDTLRLLAARARANDQRPIDWAAMR